MFKSVFRLRRAAAAALILLVLLPFCATAEEVTSQVYVAVDNTEKGSRGRAFFLAGALAYHAEQAGSHVAMYNITFPDNAFYTSGNSDSLREKLQEFQTKTIPNEYNGYKNGFKIHFNTFLDTFFGKADFSAPSVDIHILSHLDRGKMVYSTWQDTGSFQDKYVNGSYVAIRNALDAYPNLRLHFYYFGSSENKYVALDEKLQEEYPGRVFITIYVKDDSLDDVIPDLLTSGSSWATHIVEGNLPAEGGIPYSKTGVSELISLKFSSELPPESVRFVFKEDAPAQADEQIDPGAEEPDADMQPVQEATQSEADAAPDAEVLSLEEMQSAGEATSIDETASLGEATPAEGTVPDGEATPAEGTASDEEGPTGEDSEDAGETPTASENEPNEGEQAGDDAATEAAPEENCIPSYYDETNHTYWLYLPKDSQNDEFTICYDVDETKADETEAVTYTLKTWAELPDRSFTLLDEQKNPAGSEGAVVMPSEKTTWTLELKMPGVTFDDVDAKLIAVVAAADEETDDAVETPEPGDTEEEQKDKETDNAADEAEHEPTVISGELLSRTAADGITTWTFELQAFPPHTEGELRMSYTIWGEKICDDTVLPYHVENRAPVLETDENSLTMDVYYDIPESSDTPNADHTSVYDLKQYFRELDDGDTLTFSGSPIEAGNYAYKVADGKLIYTAKAAVLDSNLPTVTVTATDSSDESVSLTFSFRHHSMRGTLDQLRLNPDDATAALLAGSQFSVPIGEEKTLHFLLPASQVASLDAMLKFLELPAIEDCLKVVADGNPCAISRSENNELVVTVELPESEQTAQNSLNLQAQFVYAPAEGEAPAYPAPILQELPNLFGSLQFEVNYQNNPPSLKTGVNADNQLGTCDIDGMPGKYEAINLLNLCEHAAGSDGRFRLDEYFENDEPSEALTYTILVNCGHVSVTAPASANAQLTLSAGQSCTLTAEEASQGVEILLLMPGSYHIEIFAKDTEHESAQRLSYSVRLVSSFMRSLIIGLCAAAILLIILVVVMIVRRKLKPSFGAAYAEISYTHDMGSVFWSNDSHTWLSLEPYGKDPVSLLALLVASGQLLPRTASPETLAHITFTPTKQGGVMVACGGKDNVRLFRDRRPDDAHRVMLRYDEPLSIQFTSEEAVSLCIHSSGRLGGV